MAVVVVTFSVASYAMLDFARGDAAAQAATLTGSWRHTRDAAEQTRRHEAIDRVTQSMGMFMQGPARERLRETTTPAPEITLTDDGARVTIVARGRRVTAPVDGTPTRVTGDREAGTLRARRQNGQLVVTVQGENGTRTTTYALSADGSRLILDVRLESERLSGPLGYRVTYVRR